MAITRLNRAPYYVTKSGSDLNDMQPGELWWGTSFANAPESGWYMVDCLGQGLFQTAYRHTANTTTPNMYIRSKTNGVWQPWSKVSFEHDSGWKDLPLASGFAAYDTGSYLPKYRKIGNLVEVTGAVKPNAQIAATMTTFATLPSGYRPTRRMWHLCQGSGSNKWHLGVSTSGEMSVDRYGTTSSGAIPSGTWLPFTAVFFA